MKTLVSNPYLEKALMMGGLFGLGDVLCQCIEYQQAKKKLKQKIGKEDQAPVKFKIEGDRLLRMAAFGFLVEGPVGHIFYSALERYIPGKVSIRTVAPKLFFDQFLFGSVMLASFFTFSTLAEGKDFEEVKAKLKADYVHTYTYDLALWIPAQTLNFFVVPASYRLLYVGVVSVFWNTYLSSVQNNSSEQQDEAESKKH
eukprot:TRINITY_DN9302_c0_g1_i1.p1 TRINITY_DN9302_c0_g1~~TRINITY_DN9302_c0_g1_i1.p1  ORF type:complete len:219 (+),score=31.89 TRINITY_DN9302_c0_g1_i1:61-657(+)